MDISTTLKERGERYGVFADHARIAQRIQNAMREQLGWSRLADDQKQALTVIADKIARMLNGDPNYIDNWHDIIGYAKLVESRLEGEQAKSTEALLKSHTHSVVTTIAVNDNAQLGLTNRKRLAMEEGRCAARHEAMLCNDCIGKSGSCKAIFPNA
jgi:hypothetical protein